MKLSVVTTMYCSAPYIDDFYKRIINSVKKITKDYEIIFVDDGSPDNSLLRALNLYKKDKKVVVIELSRNFGHHKAMMTGLKHTKGDIVLMIDVDLEEKPELLEVYWDRMQADTEIDVVYGIQNNREGSFIRKFSGEMFYRILNYLSGENMPINISFSRLMSRRYVNSLILFQETEMYIGGLWHITGFSQACVPITKTFKGVSSYTFRKKMKMVIDAVTSFSDKPLIFIFYIGIIIFLVSGVVGFIVVIRKFFLGYILSGWTSLILSIWFLSGLIIFSLGVIAIYLAKIFIETKNRPYTIIRSIYKNDKNKE